MNKRTRKKYAKLYFRQGVLSVILLAVTLYFALSILLEGTFFPPTLTNLSALKKESFTRNHSTVNLSLKKLYDTGCEGRSGKKTTGRYYYTLSDDLCLFVLLDTDKQKAFYTDYSATFTLMNDDSLTKSLIHSLARDIGWSSESLGNITLPVIASEPDHHPVSNILFIVGCILCTGLFLISGILGFYHYICCKR